MRANHKTPSNTTNPLIDSFSAAMARLNAADTDLLISEMEKVPVKQKLAIAKAVINGTWQRNKKQAFSAHSRIVNPNLDNPLTSA